MSSWSPSTSGAGWKDYLPSGVSSAVASGVETLASGVVGAVSSSVPREPSALSSWVPTSVKAYLPNGELGRGCSSDRDQVVSLQFDVDTGSPAQPQFLSVGFRNGFQLWEVLDAADDATQGTRETLPLREVLSVRQQGHTRLVKVLPSLSVPEDSVLSGCQPCLAVVAGDEVGDMNLVRIFSMKTNQFVHQLRFHGDVHNIVCNREWMIVVLKNQLMVHSVKTLAPIHTFTTFPSPTDNGAIALGPRWLAYPANQPLRLDGCLAPTTTFGSPSFDVAVGVAGTVATGAMQLGEMSVRALNSYISCSPPLAPPPERAMEFAGSVIVRDVQNSRIFHHFKAHDNAVCLMKFDPSSLLLATASMDGHNVNVFEMDPLSGKMMPHHLYKLVRGVTSTQIRDIAFSVDSRWMAVTSLRGTSHIYPINADGSIPSVDTHVPSKFKDADCQMYPQCTSYSEDQNPPTTVFAVTRIRTDFGGRSNAAETAAACARFAMPKTSNAQFRPSNEALFLVSGEACLARYNLRPFSKVDPDSQRESLELDFECRGTSDICRRESWDEQSCPADRMDYWASAPARHEICSVSGCIPDWMSNAEFYAHERSRRSKLQMKAISKMQTNNNAIEKIPCEILSMGNPPGADSVNEDDELDDYYIVEANPRAVMPTLLSGPTPIVHSAPKERVQESTSGHGIYGGLPSSLGSSPVDAPFLDSRSMSVGTPSVVKASSIPNAEIRDNGRHRSQQMDLMPMAADDTAVAVPGEDQALLDLDGWESRDRAEFGFDPSSDSDGAKQEEQTSPGLAASSMMLFDQDLECEDIKTVRPSQQRDKGHDESAKVLDAIGQMDPLPPTAQSDMAEEEISFRPATKRSSMPDLSAVAQDGGAAGNEVHPTGRTTDDDGDDWDDDWDSQPKATAAGKSTNVRPELEPSENSMYADAIMTEAEKAEPEGFSEEVAPDNGLVFGAPPDSTCFGTSPEQSSKEVAEEPSGSKPSKKKKDKKKKKGR